MIDYDPAIIEDGIDELDLCIAACDDRNGEWYPLESHVDLDNNTIWAEISHFSLYAVMVNKQPADISVTGLTVNPEEINEGEAARVETILVNSGATEGSYEVVLKIDDVVKETKVVEVAGNGSATVSFDLDGLSSGTYEISIGDAIGTITVKEIMEPAPAIFSISSLEISPEEVGIGDDVRISVKIDNTGETEGEYQVVCKVDGVVVDQKGVTLGGGSGVSVIFTLAIDEAGDKTIEINGLTGSLVVKEVEEEPSLKPETGTVAEILNAEALPIRPSFNWLLFGIIIIGGITIIGVLVYIFAQRIGSIKE